MFFKGENEIMIYYLVYNLKLIGFFFFILEMLSRISKLFFGEN